MSQSSKNLLATLMERFFSILGCSASSQSSTTERGRNALKRKKLLHEQLEERQLLAVDFGLATMSLPTYLEEPSHYSSGSNTQCCETIHVEETALISSCLFSDEIHPQVYGSTTFEDWCTLDTFHEWKETISPEVFEAIRTSHLEKYHFSDTHTLQQCLDDLPSPRTHGNITPLILDKMEFSDGSDTMMSMCGGSGGSGGHSSCSYAPWLCGGIGGGSTSSGGTEKTMILTSSTGLVTTFYAGDMDETCGYVDENLQMKTSGITSSISLGKSGSSYYFTMTINISQPGDLVGEVWVVDTHGLSSNKIKINIELVRIDGFEYQEKAPGETQFKSLEDTHVVWAENTNRMRFLTSRQIDYDNQNDLQKFLNLFDYQIKAIPWNYDSNSGYIQSTSGWQNYNSGLGVYSLRVVTYKKGTSTILNDFYHGLYYCFNAISGIAWETAQGYTSANSDLQIISNGSNVKVYPEESLNTTSGTLGPLKNMATVKVSVAKPIPSGLQGTVHIDWFDPNNPIGSTKTPTGNGPGVRDNHGTASLTPKTLTFNQNNGTINQFAKLTIGNAYAGDNYIIAAHPNSGVVGRAKIDAANAIAVPINTSSGGSGGSSSGGSGGSGGTSSIVLPKSATLTVWRTLWVERDQMTFTFPSGSVQTAMAPPIDGFVKSELARACIDLKEFLPNPRKTVAGSESVQDKSVSDLTPYAASRDTPTPTSTFWTVLMLGAFRSTNGNLGVYGGNTILVFNWGIESAIEDWNRDNPSQQVTSVVDSKRRNSLHEIGHSFGLADKKYTDGIMSYQENMYNRLLPANKQFREEELRTIQSQSKPK